MKTYNIAILGATGAVGAEMLKILEERKFPVNELRLLASNRSAGLIINTYKGAIAVKAAEDSAFEDIDIVLGAAENNIAEKFAPAIKKSGAVFVDNSSAFRLDPDVPLVVPEINPDDAKLNHGIIANPNCSTIITLVAINAINQMSEIKSICASTYQAVSGAGAKAQKEMYTQTEQFLAGSKPETKEFPYQIAFNLIPQIGEFQDNGYTKEEMKLQNEGRKILHLPKMKVSCTCVRVPVERSHSISAVVVTENHLEISAIKNAVANSSGCRLIDSPEDLIYPMPLSTSNQDKVYVGRIRRDFINENGINIWCCGDQVRKGAATNAVQIAELLIDKY